MRLKMNKKPSFKHYAWYCPLCKKIDLVDTKEYEASPEHIPYRGMDIGDCSETMIKLYIEEGESV